MIRWFAAGVMVGIMVSGYVPTGICHSGKPTWATQGACSHHGGVMVWLRR
jgi:hypothetical protein